MGGFLLAALVLGDALRRSGRVDPVQSEQFHSNLLRFAATVMSRRDPLFGALTGVTPPDKQWPFLVAVLRGLAGLSLLAMIHFASAILLMPTCPALR
jgi:hypothetical protein